MPNSSISYGGSMYTVVEEVVVEEVVVLLIEVVVLSTDNSADVSTVVDEHAIKIIVSKVNNIFLIG